MKCIVLLALITCATFARADITGTAILTGQPPPQDPIDMSGVGDCAAMHPDPVMPENIVVGAHGELKNVVVSIKADDPKSLGGEPIKSTAVLDQKGCMYVPHVLAVMVGQPIVVKNDDACLHNVHSMFNSNPNFNFGQPTKDPGKPVDPMTTPEYGSVRCDEHPWMRAYIVSFAHPFFAVTDADGKFTIPGKLKPGQYTLVAWHERFGTQEAKITVDAAGNAAAHFTFKVESADASKGAAPARG